MFENITAGWKLGSAIRKLVFQDRKLVIYPIVSGIVILIETMALLVSFFLFAGSGLAFYAFLFLYYVIVYFTSVYVLVAMLIAFKAFEKKAPISIAQAFSTTAGYSVIILEWAVFEAIVTMIIRAIEQRLGAIGSLIFGLGASIAMGIATTFAVPVILEKRTGPIATVKESTGFILHNFGKAFGGLLYTDLYSLLFIIGGIVVIVLGILAFSVSFALGGIIAIVGIMLLVFGGMLSYILSNVYKLVLYDYMNDGKLPPGLSEDLVRSCIKQNPQQSQSPPGSFVK